MSDGKDFGSVCSHQNVVIERNLSFTFAREGQMPSYPYLWEPMVTICWFD